MSYAQRLDLKQSQQLVMTPQLQQAIKLLQMSHQELASFIADEIETNPLLERKEGDEHAREGDDYLAAQDAEPAGEVSTKDTAEAAHEPADMADIAHGAHEDDHNEAPLDTDYDNHWAPEASTAEGRETMPSYSASAGGDSSFSGKMDNLAIDLAEARPASLREHVIAQVNMDIPDPTDRLIGLALVDHLDERGYLASEVEDIAGKLNCPARDVERVLTTHLHRMDPVGIFARDLKECMAIQLREMDRFDPVMEAFVENIELLAERKLQELQRICGADEEDLAEMIGEIRRLEPRPASGFEDHTASVVTPDILMRAKPGGGWVIELNPDALPRVLVNESYYATIAESGHISKTDKSYLSDCMANANWLVKALDQRANTILKVASEIVRQQERFFLHGVEHLKPIILKDVADAIEMHESTVSRVTANKFMATPRGLFELKYFFSPAIPRLDGAAATSAESVRARIRKMVDGEEDAKSVLSDDKMVEILRADGVDVARRTVAKYREGMGIANSVQRRRDLSIRISSSSPLKSVI